jgi:beta-galactosidase
MTIPAVLGAQYYRPPNPPRADWSRDLGRMRAAGLNTVKYWACWSWMGQRPDVVDFADLDELMDLAEGHGLGVVVNTILENAPYRLEQRWPQARYLDHEDRPVHLTSAMNTPGGGWPGLCFDHEPVWQAAEGFLTSVVERYRDHPALRVWDVWNEPHLEPASYFPDRLYCYCTASVAKFRDWLRDRYGSLDGLNRAWSRRYGDWAQVAPPRLFESVPDMIDWRLFWFDNLAGLLRRRCATVRAADPVHPVMTHVALSGFTGQLATHTLDEFDLAGPVDIYGTSSFPTWLMADDHVEHLFNLDTARDAAEGKPFWQAELQGGRGRRDGLRSTGQPAPEVVRLWIWNALAAGATGVMFWQWRPELLGPESPGYGLCTPDGATTGRVAAVAGMAEVVTHPSLRDRVPEPPSTGLLVSRRAALHAFATDRTMHLYRDAILGGYRMLTDIDLTVAILHEDRIARSGVPAHIQRLYWPMPSVADRPMADALTAFVDGGGTLVAESAPGEYRPDGSRRTTVPGCGLDQLFGVRQVESDALPSAEPPIRLVDGGSLRGSWQRESLTLLDAEPVGYFADGQIAVTSRPAGSGRAVLVASYPSVGYAGNPDQPTREAVAGLLGAPAAGLLSWSAPGPGLVSRDVRLADGRRAVFAINWSTRDEPASCAAPVTTLPAPGPATHHVVVPARTGVLLIETRP